MPIVDDVVLSSQSTVQSVDTVTVSSPVSLLPVNCLSETLFDDSTANTYQVDHFIDVVPLKTSVVENHADNQMDTKTYMEGQMLQLHEHVHFD